ncbi:hypothetical protein OIE13_22160 [Streptosporangium sp. NBC_01810]|uniref:hypothetical protein n=1 Tax=Streptosporangium sp. NBC_01810 TaxID=2975951 RepID=UPI002DDC6AC7|nr:hypothetical protein [Streptosporangium sp. NBC_01810]WSA23647.1 hypothetical protein OIE13_22160 [Streptosporangium sp. NBC_01810]
MSTPDGQTGTPAPATEYGVRWTRSPGHKPTVIPSTDAHAAAQRARRVRAQQRVFGNIADAIAVYRVAGGEWTILLPTYADALIEDFQKRLREQPEHAPDDQPNP